MHIATTYRLEVCKGHLCLMPSCGRVRVTFMYNLRELHAQYTANAMHKLETTVVQESAMVTAHC